MERAAGQMATLLDDLLDVTRIEAGRFTVQPSPQDPAGLLKEAVERIESIAEQRKVGLRLQLPAGLPLVQADRERVLQVLGNLLGNAVKFTPASGQVTLSAERLEDAVAFAVQDTGPGIPREHLERVFDRYWQAQRHHQRLGSGLGLTIARGIIAAHGARIWVESEPGQGSCFRFTLRLLGTQAGGRTAPTLLPVAS